MMAVLELYGKCKELGYCDCSGFFGCVDPRPPASKPVIENELAHAMRAEQETSDYKNYAYRQELEAIEQSEGGLVECEVCDRSHLPDHPHITNVEGDTPLDDADPDPDSQKPAPEISRELPDWLKDKLGSQAILPRASESSVDQTKLCQVCGEPWAPRHACSGAQPPETDFNRPVAPQRKQTKCELCGLVRRSNHQCKAQKQLEPRVGTAKRCGYCEAAGELCIRHGGLRSDYETPRGGRQIARELPKPVPATMPAPVSVTQTETTDTCRNGHPRTPENTYERSDGRRECKKCKQEYKSTVRPTLPVAADPELAAMAAIVEAFTHLCPTEIKRVLDYAAARFSEAAE
jgi:hypothetical protein